MTMNRKKHIITIAGAGSARVPALVGNLIEMKERFPLTKIIFYDIDNERMGKMQAYDELVLKTYYPEVEVVFTTDMDVAYCHTDFVFCQMRVGKGKMRSYDEKMPLKYGLVGQETCGPGGFSYGCALWSHEGNGGKCSFLFERYLDSELYKSAAIVALGLDRLFPDDKRILNLCDQPFSLMKSFAKILGIPQETLRARYFGLNHFGWFTDLFDTAGNNYFDQLRDYLKNHDFKPFNAEQRSKSWLDTYVRVNKYMQYFDEYIPTTYLQYYFFPDEIVQESNPQYTRVDEARDSREKEVFEVCGQAVGRDTMDGITMLTNGVFGKLMVEVAESIAYDLHNEFIVLVKNNGIIPNFEKDAIVEVAGTIGKNGAEGYYFGNIDMFYKGLMENQYAYESLTVDAFIEQDYKKALEALTLNRTVIDPEKAKAILDDFQLVSKDYWVLK